MPERIPAFITTMPDHSVLSSGKSGIDRISGRIVKRYDRYVYVRSAMHMLFLSAVLVGINWINVAVRGLNELASAGQEPKVIAQYFVVILPRAADDVVPFAVFVALTYAFFRLHSDKEINAFKNAGIGPVRLICPFIVCAVFGAVLSTLLSHSLVPASRLQTEKLNSSTLGNLTSRQIKQRLFHFPVDGLAVYVAGISDSGTLEDVFIHDARDTSRERTYFARMASLVRVGQDPMLELAYGHVEEWHQEARRLETLKFDSLRINLSGLIPPREAIGEGLRNMSSLEMLSRISTAELVEGTERSDYLNEIHERIAKSLRSLIYPVMGVTALILADALGVRHRYILVPTIAAVVMIYVAGNYLEESVLERALPAALMHLHYVMVLLALLVVFRRLSTLRMPSGGVALMPRSAD